MAKSTNNKSDGFVKLDRSIQGHWLWANATYLQWWLDILMHVNFTETYVRMRGDHILIKRGQFMKSQGDWAHDWRVTRSTVNKFLKRLEEDLLINIETIHYKTLITVIGYPDVKYDSLYQDVLHKKQKKERKAKNKTKQNTEKHFSHTEPTSYKEAGNSEETVTETEEKHFSHTEPTSYKEAGNTLGNTLGNNVYKIPFLHINSTINKSKNWKHFINSLSISCEIVGNTFPTVGNTLGNTFPTDNQKFVGYKETIYATPFLIISNKNIIKNINKHVDGFSKEKTKIVWEWLENAPLSSGASPHENFYQPSYFQHVNSNMCTLKLDQCLEVFMLHSIMDNSRAQILTAANFTVDGVYTNDMLNLMYRWALCFNRFLVFAGEHEKQLRYWVIGFGKWLGSVKRNQDPDKIDVTNIKNKQNGSNGSTVPAEKVGGINRDKTAEFLKGGG